MARPAVFVGSSSEGLPIAQAVQVLLDRVCEVKLWNQGTFRLTLGSLESLVSATPDLDFAVLVLTSDDLSTSRGITSAAPRDNVLFELGLFMGSLGRNRTFILYDRTSPPALPSDLAGVTPATFAPHIDGNMEAALGAPCTQIQNSIERLGTRDRGIGDLRQAAQHVEGAGAAMQATVKLLARSRKVELEIFIAHFGRSLAADQLVRLRGDLADLEAILESEP